MVHELRRGGTTKSPTHCTPPGTAAPTANPSPPPSSATSDTTTIYPPRPHCAAGKSPSPTPPRSSTSAPAPSTTGSATASYQPDAPANTWPSTGPHHRSTLPNQSSHLTTP